MKTHALRLVTLLFFCTTISLHAAPNTTDSIALTITTLDQLLSATPPTQKLLTIGDMQFPVATLRAFRNQLAGAPSPQSAFDGATPTWPGGNIYYEFSTDGTNAVPANLQRAFTDAANEWATFASLHFIPRTTQTNYVTVQVDAGLEGGQSAVGMIGGQQFLSISPNAWNRGTLCHELGHTLGLVHEHQRSDRDSFVTINTNNIVPGGLGNFILLPDSRNQGAYDFLSVMHYARNYLSIDPSLDTIVPLPAYTQYINLMGQPHAVTLSLIDRTGMATVYGATSPITPVVTNTADSGPGTLRTALYYAFDNPRTTITFNLSTNDPNFTNNVFTIQPTDQLPDLVSNTTVQGFTQAGSGVEGRPNILINGSLAPVPSTFAAGLHFVGANCSASGLTINGFSSAAVLIESANAAHNTVAGCYLGTDSTGAAPAENTNGGPLVVIRGGAHQNTIGGTNNIAFRNIISGSPFQGIVIFNPGTDSNSIQGNYIGLSASGLAAVPNGFAGVEIYDGAHANVIGGTTPSARNIISGNTDQGVALAGAGTSGNLVEGNYIGLAPTGATAISNGFAGVEMFSSASSNLIANNLISGNTFQGVAIDGPNTTANVIAGNLIGLGVSGTNALPNGGAGIGIFDGATANLIGGHTPAARNIISGNTLQGVILSNPTTTANLISGNYLGLDPTGAFAIPNTFSGVNLADGTSGNVIGGLAPGAGNVISGNLSQGISFQDSGTASNIIAGNLIGLNAAGTLAVSNAVGIEFFDSASQNLIVSNLISGNGGDGIMLDNGASSNTIAANLIGLDATATTPIPNLGSGVEMFVGANNNLVGGPLGRNYISGNGQSGIAIEDDSYLDVVQGNTIGLNVLNVAAPNGNAGITFFGGAQSNLVGGILPGQANLIADNGGSGVELYDTNTLCNTIRGNSIYDNAGGFAIYSYLANGASGPFMFDLGSAILGTNLIFSGAIGGTPGTTVQMDFYASPPPAASAQAATYLGSSPIVISPFTSPPPPNDFNAGLNAIVPAGQIITATITDPFGNTSTLSSGIPVTATDHVGDGITDAWRAAHFGNATTTNAQSCATCDPDHDGVNNLQEFLANTDPNDPASALRLTSVTNLASGALVTFPTVTGITYRLESKTDLTAPNWPLVTDQILGTGAPLQIPDPAANPTVSHYYRLTVLP